METSDQVESACHLNHVEEYLQQAKQIHARQEELCRTLPSPNQCEIQYRELFKAYNLDVENQATVKEALRKLMAIHLFWQKFCLSHTSCWESRLEAMAQENSLQGNVTQYQTHMSRQLKQAKGKSYKLTQEAKKAVGNINPRLEAFLSKTLFTLFE